MLKIITLSFLAAINISCGTNEIQAIDSPTDSLPQSTKITTSFPWLSNNNSSSGIVSDIATPKNYSRAAAQNNYASWLPALPLLPNNAKVMLFDGREKPYQAGAYRVLNIDIGTRDLQQCADAIMRLKAEYHYSRKEYSQIHFNYTSGTKVSFDDWRKGKKPIVSGSKVNFSAPTGKEDNSYPNFKKYLQSIYSFAGTASLEKELQKVSSLKDIQIGDVFIKGGFPGHAIIVMDIAQSASGEKVFLLAQSYMPAQSIHILKNLNQPALSPWYSLRDGEELRTPEWTFAPNTLHRFK
jgi:hypothetical protein